jgi:hypothetical protein
MKRPQFMPYLPSSNEGRQLIDYRFAASESRRC